MKRLIILTCLIMTQVVQASLWTNLTTEEQTSLLAGQTLQSKIDDPYYGELGSRSLIVLNNISSRDAAAIFWDYPSQVEVPNGPESITLLEGYSVDKTPMRVNLIGTVPMFGRYEQIMEYTVNKVIGQEGSYNTTWESITPNPIVMKHRGGVTFEPIDEKTTLMVTRNYFVMNTLSGFPREAIFQAAVGIAESHKVRFMSNNVPSELQLNNFKTALE